MPRNNQRTDVSRQELQRLEARLTSLAGRTARQASDSDELPVDAVDTVNIANDAVTEDKIADGAVTFKKLASGGTTSGGGGNYSSQAETRRSGATDTVEVYYTARPDGDGYAESEVSDVGETQVIQRRLYYSDKFDADPDTSGDWTAYTTQPADDETFANSKTALLAGLSDTDGTANTRGTLPVSLKMERTLVPNLLLDDYSGAEAAFSVRKLRAAYTGNAMRVREDSGNTETDIGFDSNGDLDTAAIASHCGSANGYVVTWYDQSGNAANATQSTAAKQPQIYNGTAVLTENGKPCLLLDGSGDTFSFTTSAATLNHAMVQTTSDTAFILVSHSTNTNIFHGVCDSGSSTTISRFENPVDGTILCYKNSALAATNGTTTRSALRSAIADGSQNLMFWNGFDNVPAATYQVGDAPISSGFNYGAEVQEFIFYSTDHTSNRSGIETNINTYFSIY